MEYGVDNVDKVIYQLSVHDVLSVMVDKFQEELSAMTDEEIVELINQVSDNFQIDEWSEIMYYMIDFFINLKRQEKVEMERMTAQDILKELKGYEGMGELKTDEELNYLTEYYASVQDDEALENYDVYDMAELIYLNEILFGDNQAN